MDTFVITIARELGSGGSRIGRMLSQRLGYSFYDREILQMAADESGIDAGVFTRSDEQMTRFNLFRAVRMANDGQFVPSPPDQEDRVSDENLFRYQARVIRQIAKDENCVIVGRCADYILRGQPNVFNVFVHAPLDHRIASIMEAQGVDEVEAERRIRRTDRRRAEYYRFFTGLDWQDAKHYDLCLNTGKVPFETGVQMIEACMKLRFVL